VTNLDAEGRELVADLIREQLARGGMVVAAVHHGLPPSVRNVTRLELAA
jgi:ABC-type transport system involved in cytochrome c biogenesis ATPase subunit